MKKFNLVVLFVLGSVFSAFSQVPGAFNYQAVVRNSSGDIISNASVSFRVSILQNSETGSPVYVETQHTTTNSFGLVSLKIGQGTVVSGNLENAAWGTAPHFIKVEVDPAGGSAYSLLGTSELLSVPYALQAENVSNDKVNDADADPANELQSISLSGTVLTLSDGGGSVTLPSSAGSSGDNWGTQTVVTNATLSGNGTTASPLSVVGDLSDNQTLSVSGNELSISGGNSITLPDSGKWTNTAYGIAYKNGHVGIGVNAINTNAFTVSNDLYPAIYATNNDASNSTIQIYNQNPNGSAAWFRNKITISDGTQGEGKVLTSNANGSASWQTPASGSSLWTASGDNIIYSNGSVNVGNGIPDTRILFQAKTDADLYSIGAINNGASPTIYAMNNGSGPSAWIAGKVRITDGTQGAGKVLTSDVEGNTSWQTPASDLWTASGDNIYRSSGFVGIGTTTPSAPLEIKSNNAADTPSLIIGSESTNDPARPGIKFINNTSQYIAADDGSDESFGFYSKWSNTRTYDAILRVHGKASGSWGKYLAITHDGSDGEITTDTGALKLSPANGEVIINGNLELPESTATTGIIRSGANILIHTYGTNNFFAGENAGNLTMTGYANTASGTNALQANTTGRGNTASGKEALRSNTTGLSNTASGAYALYANTTGNENTASGTSALYNNTTGSENTASGHWALFYNTTGSGNTASGKEALNQNTTGYDNTACGRWALNLNDVGNYNTAIGGQALSMNKNGLYNTACGYKAGYDSGSGGIGNTFVGHTADAHYTNLTNAMALGYGALVYRSNEVRIGNFSVTRIGGQVGWSETSDKRKKKDISDVPLGLDFITALRPVQFRMIDGNDRLDFGFIAQDIESLLGEDYNILGIDGDPERTLSLRYTEFIAPMVKAMQEQQGQIEEQQKIIDALKGENIQLKANNMEIISRLEKLENLMSVSAQK